MEKNDKERLDVIWNKGQVVKGYNEKCYRKDACGAWMIREKYGDRTSPFGWEIDHIYPKSKLSESIFSCCFGLSYFFSYTMYLLIPFIYREIDLLKFPTPK